MDDYDMDRCDYTNITIPRPLPLNKQRIQQLCVLPVVKLPIMGYSSQQFMYTYLKYCQGTRFAVTAIHTKEEVALYAKLLVDQRDEIYPSQNASKPNFNTFALIWNKNCKEGNNIYYKTAQHLQTYFNVTEDRKKYCNSVLLNLEVVQHVRFELEATACATCTAASTKPSPPTTARIVELCHEDPPALPPRNRPIAPARLILQSATFPTANNIAGITSHPNLSLRVLLPPLESNDQQQQHQVVIESSSSPTQKRKRNERHCSVCEEVACGGRSKQKLCVNKCGLCKNEDCLGRYDITIKRQNPACRKHVVQSRKV